MLLLKSFPVPIGITPMIMVVRSTSNDSSSESTQGIVPSPPQMMILQSLEALVERDWANWKPYVRLLGR